MILKEIGGFLSKNGNNTKYVSWLKIKNNAKWVGVVNKSKLCDEIKDIGWKGKECAGGIK